MNIHFGNQSQFELFPGTTGEPIENTAPRFIFSRIVLTFENVIVIFVFVIVSLIIAFSFGVERGRGKVRYAQPAVQTIAAPTMPSVMPQTQISVVSAVTPAVAAVTPTMVTPRPAMVQTPTLPVLPKVAPPAPSEKIVDKRYTVQVASYKIKSAAEEAAAGLKAKGLDGFVVVKGDYTILCVGRFAAHDEAKQMLNKLKKRFKDSIVRSL